VGNINLCARFRVGGNRPGTNTLTSPTTPTSHGTYSPHFPSLPLTSVPKHPPRTPPCTTPGLLKASKEVTRVECQSAGDWVCEANANIVSIRYVSCAQCNAHCCKPKSTECNRYGEQRNSMEKDDGPGSPAPANVTRRLYLTEPTPLALMPNPLLKPHSPKLIKTPKEAMDEAPSQPQTLILPQWLVSSRLPHAPVCVKVLLVRIQDPWGGSFLALKLLWWR